MITRLPLALAVGVALSVGVAARSASAALPQGHPAIVGGAPAPAGSWPWLAFVIYNNGSGAEECSGTVVAPNIVLTAAHCAENVTTGMLNDAGGYTVVTGSLDWTNSAARQVSSVTEVITHGTYVTTSVTQGINVVGDAALLVLAVPTSAPPIALASATDFALIQPGAVVDMAGWGLTNPSATVGSPTLQDAATVVQSPSYCVARRSAFASTAQVCTVDAPYFATTICEGDSGGPLVADAGGGTWVEVGIASTTACNPLGIDVFTRGDYIQPWVNGWIAALPPTATTAPVLPTATPAPPSAPPATPTRPEVGTYTGKTGQFRGRISLTDTQLGITTIKSAFDLHCTRGARRGPYTEAASWKSPNPLTLTALNGGWLLAANYHTANGWRYSIAGTLSAEGAATGTLRVSTKNGACSTGLVHWAAAITT